MRNKPMLHPNYRGAKHKPDYIRKYDVLEEKQCKFCGAEATNIVTYDMPVKDNMVMKVTRCTKCDNLLHFASPRPRTEE